MSILFLDIDGVLNHSAWLQRAARRRPVSDADQIDPKRVKKLSRIVERTGCVVIVSSSWRHAHSYTEIEKMLVARGFTGRLSGATPTEGQTPGGIFIGCDRGAEIQAWLDSNGNPGPICILRLWTCPSCSTNPREHVAVSESASQHAARSSSSRIRFEWRGFAQKHGLAWPGESRGRRRAKR